jgi:hypothetical protein
MPRKRTHAKRRADWRAELEAWDSVFSCGFAFDGDLQAIGLSDDPPLPMIHDAWQRLGERYVAEHGRETDLGRPIWALTQFGEPAHA